MLKISVKSDIIETVQYRNKTTGNPATLRLQTVFIYMPNSQGVVDGTYDKISMPLNEAQAPFPIGDYQLSPACLYLDRNRRLAVSLNNMQPIQNSLKQAA